MNKKGKYARNGALILGIGNAVLNAFNQLNKVDKDPDWKFDWRKFFSSGVKGAVLGGTGGFVVGAIVDHQNSLEKPINTDAFLFSVVGAVRLKKDDSEYQGLDEQAVRLTELLKIEIGDKLAGEPMRLGSTENGTALADNFDIDISLPFKPDSFSSTGQMFSYTKDCLEKLIGQHSIVDTRDQKKSIGVIFKLQGEERKIDIVPYKLTPKRGNKTSGYLYVNDSGGNSTYTKTNIHALKSVKLNESQKKIVIALKHWKRIYDVPIGSHLLQNFVIDAYDRNDVPNGFTQKVMMVLGHIKDNLDVAVIRSVENTNNILTNISDAKKYEIVNSCRMAIEEYEYQPNSIVNIFEVE